MCSAYIAAERSAGVITPATLFSILPYSHVTIIFSHKYDYSISSLTACLAIQLHKQLRFIANNHKGW
jgi:hypothetical protein